MFASGSLPPERPSSPEEFLQENDLPEVRMYFKIILYFSSLLFVIRPNLFHTGPSFFLFVLL